MEEAREGLCWPAQDPTSSTATAADTFRYFPDLNWRRRSTASSHQLRKSSSQQQQQQQQLVVLTEKWDGTTVQATAPRRVQAARQTERGRPGSTALPKRSATVSSDWTSTSRARSHRAAWLGKRRRADCGRRPSTRRIVTPARGGASCTSLRAWTRCVCVCVCRRRHIQARYTHGGARQPLPMPSARTTQGAGSKRGGCVGVRHARHPVFDLRARM